MNLLTLVAGPLVVPECLRAARRPWMLAMRTLSGMLLALPSLCAMWWWWMRAEIEPVNESESVVPITLGVTMGLSVLIAILLSPAILAGTLAGDRERGSIGLLLSTRVDAREIVIGRLLGKLSTVFAMLAAGWPFLILFGCLRDMGVLSILAMIGLPVAVALGAGGIAIGASSVAKRGWSALITIYLVEVLLLILPVFGLITGWRSAGLALGALNPFDPIAPAIDMGSATPLIAPIVAWLTLATIGVSFAAWRLRPSFLALVGGKAGGSVRTRTLPPVDEDRPMLWKELYIDRGAVLGWFGRILGVLFVLYLLLGSVVLGGMGLYFTFIRPDPAVIDRVLILIDNVLASPAPICSFLIQVAIALRAAVAISSERERGTWEALLTSPLTGKEILWGKLQGSLNSLRWLIAATFLSWMVCLISGVMTWWEFAVLVGQVLIIGTFSAAVGVRFSLACGTATRAMSMTVGAWFAALIGLSILALLSTLGIMLMALMAWVVAGGIGLIAPGTRPWGFGGNTFGYLWVLLMGSMYIGLTSTVVAESWARFDAICGRLAGEAGDKAPAAPVNADGSPLEGPKRAMAEDRERSPHPPDANRPTVV